MNPSLLPVTTPRRSSFLACLLAGLPVSGALAQSIAAKVPTPWDVGFGGAVMSDYNVRGISVSAHRPAITGYVEPRYHIQPNIDLYVGVSITSIDVPNRAAAQVVYYGGIQPTIGPWKLDAGISYIDYPGGETFDGRAGPNTCTNGAFFFGQCNTSKANSGFFETYGKATFIASDALTIGSNVYYSPSWVNTGAPGTYGSLAVKLSLPKASLPSGIDGSVSGELGHYWYGTTDTFYGVPAFPNGIKLSDYTTWNVGASFAYKQFTLDLRYYDTNLSKADCNVLTGDHTATFGGVGAVSTTNPSGLISNWCGATFITKVSFDATLGDLK